MAENRFWADPSTSPKRKYRFLLNLPNAGSDASWMITKDNRPSFNITEATHSYLNHTFYFPGRVEWQTVSFSIVDPVSPDATALLVGILGAAGYSIPNNLATEASKSTMSKADATKIMGLVTISALGANGFAVDEWTLHNAWLKNVTMGDFDYTDDSLVSMDVELRYDFATYRPLKGSAPGSKEVGDGATSLQSV